MDELGETSRFSMNKEKTNLVVNMTDYIDENKVYKVNFKNGVDSIIAGHSHGLLGLIILTKKMF